MEAVAASDASGAILNTVTVTSDSNETSDDNNSATAQVTVTPPATTSTTLGSSSGTLPATGQQLGWLAILGIAAWLLGTGLVIAVRPHRR